MKIEENADFSGSASSSSVSDSREAPEKVKVIHGERENQQMAMAMLGISVSSFLTAVFLLGMLWQGNVFIACWYWPFALALVFCLSISFASDFKVQAARHFSPELQKTARACCFLSVIHVFLSPFWGWHFSALGISSLVSSYYFVMILLDSIVFLGLNFETVSYLRKSFCLKLTDETQTREKTWTEVLSRNIVRINILYVIVVGIIACLAPVMMHMAFMREIGIPLAEVLRVFFQSRVFVQIFMVVLLLDEIVISFGALLMVHHLTNGENKI